MKIKLGQIVRIGLKVAPVVIAAAPVVGPIIRDFREAVREGKTLAERR